jgi:hypothetical protein
VGLIEAEGLVAGMLYSGAAFGAIEERIEQIPDLNGTERAALWLYAWSRQGGGWQRRESTAILLSTVSGA